MPTIRGTMTLISSRRHGGRRTPEVPRMIESDRALQYLQALGAAEFAHVHGALATHVRGTETLLRSWGNREPLCLAGLYHAVYGSEGLRGSLTGLSRRGAIAEVIGE